MSSCWSEVVTVLAWTKQNTMQRAMRTVLKWPQSHATRKTINMITNKYEPQQKCRLGTVSKKLLGGLNLSETVWLISLSASLKTTLSNWRRYALHKSRIIAFSAPRADNAINSIVCLIWSKFVFVQNVVSVHENMTMIRFYLSNRLRTHPRFVLMRSI